eukprot:gnl/Chilomastix_caulleri/5684.p1 GENE.gnl/Chilomastix_caulleri/5684~~gnl/Chilomastix_caulleri/5684.p1  ORF type:complete len:75 (+),score=15.00 gnl/Chilomastix_caulleri/5684:115-339(+)
MEHCSCDCGLSTKAIHVGYDSSEYKGALNVPVFMSSTFDFKNIEEGIDTAKGLTNHPIYNRIGCPTNRCSRSKN